MLLSSAILHKIKALHFLMVFACLEYHNVDCQSENRAPQAPSGFYPSDVYLININHKEDDRKEHSWQQKKLLMLNH